MQIKKIQQEKLAELLLPLFLIRAVTFWLEVEKLNAQETEDLIILQSSFAREKYLKLLLK